MVWRRTASNECPDQTHRPGVSQRPIPGPQGTLARPSGASRVGALWQWRCGWRSPQTTGRGRQAPEKTAYRLQHTYIEHAGGEPQIACELRRVMGTNPQSTLVAKCDSFPVFNPYAIPHGQLRTYIYAHWTANAKGSCLRQPRRKRSIRLMNAAGGA